ncbi:MAG: class I SAM-dependent methyltransferase [Pseudomonadota bacterium]
MSDSDAALDFSFDERVAIRYDALRGHPPDVSRQIGDWLADLIPDDGLLLEPGVGTGRIALPTARETCSVVGVDLSAEMLSALASQVSPNLQLVRADLEVLPFCSDAFDAAVCVHVLHLVDAKRVLSDILRLVKPGGLIILGRDWVSPDSFAGMLRNVFRRSVVEEAESVQFPTGARGLVTILTELGAEAVNGGEEQTAVEWQTSLSPQLVIDGMRSKDDAESWVLPEELLERVMAKVQIFAEAQWPELAATQPVTRRFVYSSFRVR